MKRKAMSHWMAVFICLLVLLTVLLIGCSNNGGTSNSGSGRQAQTNQVTIQYMSLSSGLQYNAEIWAFETLNKKYPNITVESQSVPGNDTFIAALKAKFAAGEAPDIYSFQAGNRVRELAKEGLLYDMTDEQYMSRANPVDIPFNSYQGRIYAFPTIVEYNGFFINHEVFDKYPNIKIPENFDDFIEVCEQLRAAGLRYPLILAGKDIGNVSQVDFQYLCTVVVPAIPNYYEEMIAGTRKFNDPFIREMFVKYDKLRNFVSEDSLGVDSDEAIKRFIRGEGALWIAHASTISRIRELGGEEFNFKLYPSALQDRGTQRYFNCAQARSVSIAKATKYPDEVRLAMIEYVSPEAADIVALEGKVMPAMLGADKLPDKSLEPCIPWFSSPYKVPHTDLTWIPGIKDVMRDVTQRWYMGENIDRVLDEWESQHRRLLAGNPDFIANYGKE